MKPHKVRAANRFVDRVALFLLTNPDAPVDIKYACSDVLMRPRDPVKLLPFPLPYLGGHRPSSYYEGYIICLYRLCIYYPLSAARPHRYREARRSWTWFCGIRTTCNPQLPQAPYDT